MTDSVTTLATIKEVLTKEATARKIQIQISVDVKEETVATLLTKIDPMLVYQHELAAKVKLIETLNCLLYTSPSPRDRQKSRMPSSA